MKNLAIVFSFLFFLQNIALAQQNDNVVASNGLYSNIDSISIMHQDRLEKKANLDWKKGKNCQSRKIVRRNTIIFAIAGGAVGNSIPFAKQLGHNLSEHHDGGNYHLESTTTLKSTIIGAVVGAGVGYTVGKIKAKRRAQGKKRRNSKASKIIRFISF